jgi:phosphoserine phosphatase RsbX
MRSAAAGTSPHLDWGAATLAMAGERESGDLHLVKPFAFGGLLAVVDGLGHGEEAALAAKRAVGILDQFAHEPVPMLVQRCHEALKGTRGVVMSLASLDVRRRAVTWLGVGNVEGIVLHTDQESRSGRTSLVTRGGIVGAELPVLTSPAVVRIQPGDTLVLSTDGIEAGFFRDVSLTDPPQRVADLILSKYGKSTDDSLVLVARYLGEDE